MIAKLGRAAVLAFTAVVGYLLYRATRDGHYWAAILALVVGVLLAFGLTRLARRLVTRRAVAAVWMTEGALIGIIVVGGAVTVGAAWVGAIVEGAIVEGEDEVTKAVAKAIGGAVGTVAAVLFLDDFDKETGSFWPSVITQKMFQDAFRDLDRSTAFWQAVWEERVVATVNGRPYNLFGWGLRARLKRGEMLDSRPGA